MKSLFLIFSQVRFLPLLPFLLCACSHKPPSFEAPIVQVTQSENGSLRFRVLDGVARIRFITGTNRIETDVGFGGDLIITRLWKEYAERGALGDSLTTGQLKQPIAGEVQTNIIGPIVRYLAPGPDPVSLLERLGNAAFARGITNGTVQILF